mmetsp:Transcript_48629/g.150159  ORF Transcript_48629/g.150159 Transcript_48629/m.150159 type:complete len:281 (-) Transcript_48629:950-1792(-)
MGVGTCSPRLRHSHFPPFLTYMCTCIRLSPSSPASARFDLRVHFKRRRMSFSCPAAKCGLSRPEYAHEKSRCRTRTHRQSDSSSCASESMCASGHERCTASSAFAETIRPVPTTFRYSSLAEQRATARIATSVTAPSVSETFKSSRSGQCPATATIEASDIAPHVYCTLRVRSFGHMWATAMIDLSVTVPLVTLTSRCSRSGHRAATNSISTSEMSQSVTVSSRKQQQCLAMALIDTAVTILSVRPTCKASSWRQFSETARIAWSVTSPNAPVTLRYRSS